MTNQEQSFLCPVDFGEWKIGTSQKNKSISFEWDTAVLPQSKVVVVYDSDLIKEYVIGKGLELSNADMTVTLTLNGADFVNYKGKTLSVYCSFFVEGDPEISIRLKVIKTFL